jgi:transcriptional regulator with XRE-family HTH domain
MGPVQKWERTPVRVDPGVPRRFESSSNALFRLILAEVDERKDALGRLVAARRPELGLSQSDLAERMDVSRATISRIENGQPQSTGTLMRLATALRPDEGTELQRSLEAELLLRGAITGSLASSLPPARNRLSMPRLSMPHVPIPRVSIPRVSIPRPAMPRVSIPRVSMPSMPRLPRNRRLAFGALATSALVAVVAVVAIASSGGGDADGAEVTLKPEGKRPSSNGDRPTRAGEGDQEKNVGGIVGGLDGPVSGREEPNSGESAALEPANSPNRSSRGFQDVLVDAPGTNPPPAQSGDPPATGSDQPNESPPRFLDLVQVPEAQAPEVQAPDL